MNAHDDAPTEASSEFNQRERLAQWLIRHAARNSPAALVDRLEEEWLAALAAQGGALSRLRFALGCCWATRVITHDYLASRVPANAAATEHGSIILGQYDPSYFSRRTMIFLLIVGLHTIVIYGFATGFAQKVIGAIPGPMKTTFLDPPNEHELPLPPITSHLPTAKPIKPEAVLTFEFPRESVIGDTSTPKPPPPALPAPAKAVSRILGGPGRRIPDTRASTIRLAAETPRGNGCRYSSCMCRQNRSTCFGPDTRAVLGHRETR